MSHDKRVRRPTEDITDIRNIIDKSGIKDSEPFEDDDRNGWKVVREKATLRWFVSEDVEGPVCNIEVRSQDEEESDIVSLRYGPVVSCRWDYTAYKQAPGAFAFFKTNYDPSVSSDLHVGALTRDYPTGLDWVDRLIRAFVAHTA